MDLELPLLIIRIALGLTLAAHGYNKFFKGGRIEGTGRWFDSCLLYTSPSPRDVEESRMPSSA